MDLKNVEMQPSEIKYRRLFEAAKDGILLIDPKTEQIIDANPYILSLIGYSLEEVVGKELWEIGFFGDKNATKDVITDLQAKKTLRYEDLPLKAKDGSEKQVEFISNIYAVGPVEMIQCNIRDITERKEDERLAAAYIDGLEKLNALIAQVHPKFTEMGAEITSLRELLDRKQRRGKK